MMRLKAAYPTIQHEQAALRIVEFFSSQSEVDAVLLTCSCARSRATRDSCLDIAILSEPDVLAIKRSELEQRWQHVYQTEAVFETVRQVGQYSHVDLDFVDGCFVPSYHGWTTGPDAFELGIGNLLVYSVALWERTDYFQQLKAHWLPYYEEGLRGERLAKVRRYCLNNLHHIPLYVERELYFQSLTRLYHAFGEFLQALFIARRTYPIAYDKWVREQIEEILELPELYRQLPALFEIRCFESPELADKARTLEYLLDEYVPEEAIAGV
ncbi:hypothetical protein HYR99_23530 [Candidatus Poribacteria bacterium]|nr:hypothetical protein [Candidatus Poribacteria bacterium]